MSEVHFDSFDENASDREHGEYSISSAHWWIGTETYDASDYVVPTVNLATDTVQYLYINGEWVPVGDGAADERVRVEERDGVFVIRINGPSADSNTPFYVDDTFIDEPVSDLAAQIRALADAFGVVFRQLAAVLREVAEVLRKWMQLVAEEREAELERQMTGGELVSTVPIDTSHLAFYRLFDPSFDYYASDPAQYPHGVDGGTPMTLEELLSADEKMDRIDDLLDGGKT